jgi:hypothetical protein
MSCLYAFFDHFVEDHILLPSSREALHEADLFHARSGFPKIVWGAIDGTHITITPPKTHEATFRNRHHGLSLNVLLCIGASGVIHFVSSAQPGSGHDSRIFEASALFQILLNGWRPIPRGTLKTSVLTY